MKWYWVVLIAVLALVIGYLIARQQDKSPLKKNTQLIADTLIKEAKQIDTFFTGRPNLQDPNYQSTADKLNARKKEIMKILKDFYGCAVEYDYINLKCK